MTLNSNIKINRLETDKTLLLFLSSFQNFCLVLTFFMNCILQIKRFYVLEGLWIWAVCLVVYRNLF